MVGERRRQRRAPGRAGRTRGQVACRTFPCPSTGVNRNALSWCGLHVARFDMIVAVSRRAPRFRIELKVTVSPLLGGQLVVCHTRDISDVGMCLDTAEWLPVGTRVSLTLLDPRS